MPGAMPNGVLATKPMIKLHMAAPSAVATNTPAAGMPLSEAMAGFTNRMYDMVRNVVTPHSISLEAVVPCSLSWNLLFMWSCSGCPV